MAAAIDLLADTFARARQTNARAVAIFQQADMFDPSYQPTWTNFLQVTVNRPGAPRVLTWERVPYDSQP